MWRNKKMNTIELNQNHLWLEIEPEQKESAEQKVENIDTYQYQSYLNQLALEIVLPYIQEEYPQATVTKFDYAQFWQLGVNGVAIEFDNKRLILVPNEASDIDELRISQEWIDIPGLAADYYLAVQVDVEDSLMRIWGYTTHKELKETGTYCDRDRSYFMTREQIVEDINALWLMRQYFPDKPTKAEIASIPELSKSDLTPLLDRLVNPEIRLIRRVIPFEQWAYIFNTQKLRMELMVNRVIHSTVLTYIRSNLDEKIGEIKNKQFTNQELASVAERLNNIFQTEDEDDRPYEGEEILKDFIGLDTNEELTVTRSRGELIRLEDEEDSFEDEDEELALRRKRGELFGLEQDELEDFSDQAVLLFNLTENLFNKLKGIWSNDKSDDERE